RARRSSDGVSWLRAKESAFEELFACPHEASCDSRCHSPTTGDGRVFPSINAGSAFSIQSRVALVRRRNLHLTGPRLVSHGDGLQQLRAPLLYRPGQVVENLIRVEHVFCNRAANLNSFELPLGLTPNLSR